MALRPIPITILGLALLATCAAMANAEDDSTAIRREKVMKAVDSGLAVIQKAAHNYPAHRKCFSCHHQTLPLLGISAARSAGLPVDAELPDEIVKFTETSFRGKIDELKQGEGIGGRALTIGSALWAFELGERKPDELSEAMVTFLLKVQEADGHWGLHGIRPPAEESLVMCTVQAATEIKIFAAATQREAADAAIDSARAWLTAANMEFHEDSVARVWGLSRLGGTKDQIAAARKALLETQRPDGGWSQLADRESDAYATGSALYAMLAADPRLALDCKQEQDNPKNRSNENQDDSHRKVELQMGRAVDYLIESQLPDGSWHVVTRATPVQVYFDNGDPHGKDQFLSIAATSWTTAALARFLQRK